MSDDKELASGPTFIVLNTGGQTVIRCRNCRRQSANPHDVEHRYCAGCHQFHEFMSPRNGGAA